MPVINIREYLESDLEGCAALFIKVFNAPPWNDAWTSQGAMEFVGYFTRISTFSGCVAEENGRLLGFLFGQQWTSREFFIDEMAVDQDFQRKGTGSRLVAFARGLLRARGVHSMSLTTGRSAQPAAFWVKNGFKEAAEMQFMIASTRAQP